jgi:hypothetical protein
MNIPFRTIMPTIVFPASKVETVSLIRTSDFRLMIEYTSFHVVCPPPGLDLLQRYEYTKLQRASKIDEYAAIGTPNNVVSLPLSFSEVESQRTNKKGSRQANPRLTEERM